MLERVLATKTLFDEHDLSFVGGVPYIYHCHHFNLFLDQTVDDALGPEVGAQVRHDAAREAAYQLVKAAAGPADAGNPTERTALARALFSAMGHGKLDFDTDPKGGRLTGEYLHYGYSWSEKREVRKASSPTSTCGCLRSRIRSRGHRGCLQPAAQHHGRQ
jgi:hypothetical protein